LKSWAVPKGPSLDPGDKRLAMQVEDHPVSYFHFEGRIPEGNYGAGTVMVWDTGTWEPLGDEHAMLNKGDLKFQLNGEKLKGEFVLAKMRSRRPGSKGTEWLLIKKKDDAMKPDFNIDKLDYSVLTKRSLNEIAGDEGSAEWESNRKAAGNKGMVRKGAEWLQGSVDRVIGKSGNRKTTKHEAELKVNKSGAARKLTFSAKNAESMGHPSKSPSTTKKKTSVKKKSRKAA
jgi:bifunctional non-homologous end joining protein LigD